MINDLLTRYPALKECENDISKGAELITNTFLNKNKVLICGNGGSAADCDHMSGELLKGFLSKRSVCDENVPEDMREYLQGSLPAVPLTSLTSALTASINDLEPEMVYAQLLYGLAVKGDLLIAVSTSGNAENVYNCARLARSLGVKVLSLTGKSGGKLYELSDIAIRVPESETYKVQELHLPVYHYLCACVEKNIFG